MASDRPFPPSARRLAAARAAGLTPASPILLGALACAAAAVALTAVGRAMFARLGASVRGAIETADGSALDMMRARGAIVDGAGALGDAASASSHALGSAASTHALGSAASTHALGNSASTHALGDAASASTHALRDAGHVLDASDIVSAIVALALPVLGAIAIAAIATHIAQTRALWLPRRRVPNAPAEDPQRGTRGSLGIAYALVIAVVTVGWLFAMAPRLAALVTANQGSSATTSTTATTGAGALLVVSFLAALAIAWVVMGAIDALVRFAGHTQSLRMTPEEQREDARLAGADPRWRARREKLARGENARDAIAGASVLVLGDGVAVAIAWDPVRRPVPTRTASGRAARATQLLGLARRHSIAVHHDAELATLLATGEGPVPERHWPRLAEIVAAVRSR